MLVNNMLIWSDIFFFLLQLCCVCTDVCTDVVSTLPGIYIISEEEKREWLSKSIIEYLRFLTFTVNKFVIRRLPIVLLVHFVSFDVIFRRHYKFIFFGDRPEKTSLRNPINHKYVIIKWLVVPPSFTDWRKLQSACFKCHSHPCDNTDVRRWKLLGKISRIFFGWPSIDRTFTRCYLFVGKAEFMTSAILIRQT